MGRLISYQTFMNMLAEKSVDNTRQLKRSMTQRRNGMEDLYGVCFSANGDADSPATFYISLSPDYIYLQRFAFKFVIRPFTTTVKGGTSSATVDVEPTVLNVSGGTVITPNPHDHDTAPHTHNIINGMSFIQTTSTDWHITIDGVDITEYLEEQYDTSPLFNGQGIYPHDTEDGDEIKINLYDILDVVSVMTAEGDKDTEIKKILRPGFKEVCIYSDAPFGVDAYAYIKYASLNR